MIAHLYARVSTDAQAEKGYSLTTQLEYCRKKAAELGATHTVEHIDDGYSGGEIDRPAMNALREALRDGQRIDMVVCYDPDRLARNLTHQLIVTDEIEKAGARLVFVSVEFECSPEGKLFYSIRGAISAYEKEKIKERTNRGKRGKAQSGKIVFNYHPTGYGWDAEKSMFIPNEDAETVKNLYSMALSGMSTTLIARTLNGNNVPSPKGKKWHPETIRHILTNPIYHGKVIQFRERVSIVDKKRVVSIRDKNDWIVGKCPAIVTKEEFDQVQAALVRHKKFSPRNEKQVFLLRGILCCAECGCGMHIVTCGSRGEKRYYRCSSSQKNRDFNTNIQCGNRSVETYFLDDYLWKMLENLINNQNRIRAILEDEKTSNNSYIAVYNNLVEKEQELLAERETIMRWFMQKLISQDEAEKQLNGIKKQVDSILIQRSEISIHTLREKDIDAKISNFINIVTNATNKRKACMELIEKVLYKRHDLRASKYSPPDVTLKLILR